MYVHLLWLCSHAERSGFGYAVSASGIQTAPMQKIKALTLGIYIATTCRGIATSLLTFGLAYCTQCCRWGASSTYTLVSTTSRISGLWGTRWLAWPPPRPRARRSACTPARLWKRQMALAPSSGQLTSAVPTFCFFLGPSLLLQQLHAMLL